jgi:hypothetical protein
VATLVDSTVTTNDHGICPILDAFDLPSDIVYGFIQPYDPVVRLFTEFDALYWSTTWVRMRLPFMHPAPGEVYGPLPVPFLPHGMVGPVFERIGKEPINDIRVWELNIYSCQNHCVT